MVFPAQKLIYTINVWFPFVSTSFFSRFMRKDDLNLHEFQIETDVVRNLIESILNEKKYGSMGLISEKMVVL